MRCHLPHGTKSKLAEESHQRLDQVSRQLNGEDTLGSKTIMASRLFLPEQAWAAVVSILCGGTPEFEHREALIIRMHDGQLFLPGILS